MKRKCRTRGGGTESEAGISLGHARRFPDNKRRGQASSGIQSPFCSLSSGTPCHARHPWTSSEDEFPLKTCGNDEFGHARRLLSGIQCSFSSPSSGTPCHACPSWISPEDGFPLKTCGNDGFGHARRFPDNKRRGQASSGIQSPFCSLSSGTPCHARHPWTSSEDEFPLKTCGNDEFGHARRLLSGIQCSFSSPSSGTPCHARHPWTSPEDGFPLKTCGNDGGRLWE